MAQQAHAASENPPLLPAPSALAMAEEMGWPPTTRAARRARQLQEVQAAGRDVQIEEGKPESAPAAKSRAKRKEPAAAEPAPARAQNKVPFSSRLSNYDPFMWVPAAFSRYTQQAALNVLTAACRSNSSRSCCLL